MNERKTETIKIGGGVEYAKVAARSAEFHRDNEHCSVETSCEFKEGFVLFRATVTTSKGTFTGHSLGSVKGKQKQFEKQETIAVGRALAFAGYLASGDIATAEEMEEFVTTAQLNALKLRFAKEYADILKPLDREGKHQRFNVWCKELIGEDVDYGEPASWDREWLDAAWKRLTGTASDVPFEE